MLLREIVSSDIPDLFRIRIATWENEHGARELKALGITPASVERLLGDTDYRGWIALVDGAPVGFVIGNRATGEIWVIAVLPEFEGRGIGRRLMEQAESWLTAEGCDEAWLTTHVDDDQRAVGFYRHLGWSDGEVTDIRLMRKRLRSA